ncbi:MAG: patatin-like phospholipase family protein [Clostridia bacterium]|nr:patatin-like phospholipase family protein [Clostridia bacterium]
MKHKKVKLGVAFGGGGARGIAYIGVLKAFEELGVKIDYISGTSIGSIAGAVIAFGKDSAFLADAVKTIKMKEIRNSKLIWKPSKAQNIENILLKFFGKDIMFSELQIPFKAVCTDIKSGKEVHIDAGSVAKAVSGSCAVPGVFTPVEYGDMNLVDGMLTNNVPADVVRNMGANIIFAIDLHESRGAGTESTKLFPVLSSSLGVLLQTNVDAKLKFADLVITPNLERFKATKLEEIDAMIDEGYKSVMDRKEEIIKILSKKPKKRKL